MYKNCQHQNTLSYLKDDEEQVLLSLLNLFQLLFFTFNTFFSRHRSLIIDRKVVSSLL